MTPTYILILFTAAGTPVDHIPGFQNANACILAGTEIQIQTKQQTDFVCAPVKVDDHFYQLNMKALIERAEKNAVEGHKKGGK